MTPGEAALGGLFVTTLTAYITTLITGKGKVSREEFEKHRGDKDPHRECPVHKSQLVGIEKKVDRIEEKVDKILERKDRSWQ